MNRRRKLVCGHSLCCLLLTSAFMVFARVFAINHESCWRCCSSCVSFTRSRREVTSVALVSGPVWVETVLPSAVPFQAVASGDACAERGGFVSWTHSPFRPRCCLQTTYENPAAVERKVRLWYGALVQRMGSWRYRLRSYSREVLGWQERIDRCYQRVLLFRL